MISSRKRKQLTIQPPLQWQSHAPGSLMLFGEHAVLFGYPAIACAIDHWLHIDWEQMETDDNGVRIISNLAEHHTSWSELTYHPNLSFVMTGLQWLRDYVAPYPNVRLPALTIRITSDINSTQGLGSSSAVMAALLVGFTPLLPIPLSTQEFFLIGRQLIRQVQGSGSGSDLAAALTGGVMQLLPLTGEIQRLTSQLPLVSLYVGYKTPTPEVIKRVTDHWQAFPDLFQHHLIAMSQITHFAAQAIQNNDDTRIGRLMNMAHGLMHGLGVSDHQLDHLVHQLRKEENIMGAKISGSGLGDCVIGLGKLTTPHKQEVPVMVSDKGAYITTLH